MDIDKYMIEWELKAVKKEKEALEFKKDFWSKFNIDDYRQLIQSCENALKDKNVMENLLENKTEVFQFKSLISILKLGFTDIFSKDFEMSFQLLSIEPINFHNTLNKIPTKKESSDLSLFLYSDIHNHLITNIINDIVLGRGVVRYQCEASNVISKRHNLSVIQKIIKRDTIKVFEKEKDFSDKPNILEMVLKTDVRLKIFAKNGKDDLIGTINLMDNLDNLPSADLNNLLTNMEDTHLILDRAAFHAHKNNNLLSAKRLLNKREENLKKSPNLLRAVIGMYLIINNFEMLQKSNYVVESIKNNEGLFQFNNLTVTEQAILKEKTKKILSQYVETNKDKAIEIEDFITNLKSSPLKVESKKLKM